MAKGGDKRQRRDRTPEPPTDVRKKIKNCHNEVGEDDDPKGVTKRSKKKIQAPVADDEDSDGILPVIAQHSHDDSEDLEGEVDPTPQAEAAPVVSNATPAATSHDTPGDDAITAEQKMQIRLRRRNSKALQSRRRSLTPVTKSKQYVADMYSTIIKMSSENKINSKNSWQLHLIDHIDDILVEKRQEDEDLTDTYNFQKASCTIDASVKIYSYRVDDTWNSSFKVLENLTRGDNAPGSPSVVTTAYAQLVDEEDNDDGTAQRRSTVKKMSTANTTETNLNNITMKSVDREFQVDPLFQKMSQAFDEGGAKGMLLVNLSVHDGCKIMLDSSDVQAVPNKAVTPANEPKTKPLINISSLAKRLRAAPTLVESYDICPKLEHFYDQLKTMNHDFFDKKVAVPRLDFAASQLSRPRRLTLPPVERGDDDDFDMGMGADDDNDTDYAPSEYVPTPGRATPAPPPSSTTDAPEAEAPADEDEPIAKPLLFDGVEDDEEPEVPAPAPVEDPQHQQMLESALLRSVGAEEIDEYSYFDAKALKNWAGPSHWKLKLRGVPRAKAKPAATKAAKATDKAADKGRKKEPISFGATDAELADAFKKPRAKAALELGAPVLKRNEAQAVALVYPVDLHVKLAGFYQLFTRPQSKIFALAPAPLNLVATAPSAEFGPAPRADDGDGGFDFGGADDFNPSDDYNGAWLPSAVTAHGLLLVAGLLQADRVVDKIDITYEKFAKRVDVKKLKESIWTTLPFHEADPVADEPMAAADATDKPSGNEVVSFEEMVHDVAPNVPRNVTVSFYFICMLHLANDKGLELVGQEDLQDFKIAKDNSIAP
ncbi:condensin complex subunit 2 [Achlya hypogyna]|uniref:Condensin complex subunit 2 n=1 Tax=Achlya hypogyna TaxID=1202772 RepID=A0A1V9YGH9_ACHHY|nr:condensin complex subunit 2 [Achlya hypogyna]